MTLSASPTNKNASKHIDRGRQMERQPRRKTQRSRPKTAAQPHQKHRLKQRRKCDRSNMDEERTIGDARQKGQRRQRRSGWIKRVYVKNYPIQNEVPLTQSQPRFK
ncbi:hypothetical protein MTR_4g057665 [Medicago truncatula]|uniref:Uncharacterized protein n=1 Tax=Medicago truncatula TaxID=3880 RepID=A0A072UKP8_MEDTR|nr:hypothetical protein MTR_4g057665 [Medicago truncatula]